MYLLDTMRYRLKKDGKDSLISYLKKSHYTLTWLSDRTGISRQQLHRILHGETKRSQPENLEAIAEALGLKIDFDEDGLYFEEPIDPRSDVLPDDVKEIIDMLNDRSPSERRKIMRIIRTIIDTMGN